MKQRLKSQRLSDALCETVRYGMPKLIRMSEEDFFDILDEAGRIDDLRQFTDLSAQTFEGVRVQIDRSATGCVVEHDNRYVAVYPDAREAVPETVVIMRDTQKPAIVAW